MEELPEDVRVMRDTIQCFFEKELGSVGAAERLVIARRFLKG